MKDRIAIVAGFRTPMCKAGGVFKDVEADDLGALAVRELLTRLELPPDAVDELIVGNVAQPVTATNIARVIALKAGLPERMPAMTVARNCASGAEALILAAERIRLGEAQTIVAGGTESMSNMPLLVAKPMRESLTRFNRARSWGEKLRLLREFRPRHLKPVVGLLAGLTDPVCGLIMGQTAEVLARDFHLTREAQDAFALLSQQRASEAVSEGRLDREIVPLPVPPAYSAVQQRDDGPRAGQQLADLQRLPPYFDRYNGTVTVGNSSQLTDGAAMMVVMSAAKAKALGYEPLGYLRAAATAGCEPRRMGLGPAYATARLARQSGIQVSDFDLIELNEAFAAVVLANEQAFASERFARDQLDRDRPLGDIDRDRLNVNGGAIALGHPVGMTGARLVITLLHELKRRSLGLGLATMCVGGGQGTALALEAA